MSKTNKALTPNMVFGLVVWQAVLGAVIAVLPLRWVGDVDPIYGPLSSAADGYLVLLGVTIVLGIGIAGLAFVRSRTAFLITLFVCVAVISAGVAFNSSGIQNSGCNPSFRAYSLTLACGAFVLGSTPLATSLLGLITAFVAWARFRTSMAAAGPLAVIRALALPLFLGATVAVGLSELARGI